MVLRNERVVQKVDQRVRLVETGKSPRKGKIGATRMFILECAGGEEEESDHIPFALLLVGRRKSEGKKSRPKK